MSPKIRYVPIFVSILCLIGQFVLPVQGSSGNESQSIQTYQLSLTPMGEPDYAMEYLLETPYMEQRLGNRAFLYDAALSILANLQSKNPSLDGDQLTKWLKTPFEELPLDDVHSALSKFESVIHYADLASKGEYCVWDYPVREEGFRCQMPNLLGFRSMARLLCLKVRVQTADGDIKGAMHTLRIGASMGRDLGNGPFLVQGLVGIAIDSLMFKEMRQLIQVADAPNMYWALTSLPEPLVSMHKAMQVESSMLYVELPELQNVEDEVWSNDTALKVVEKAVAFISEAGGKDLEGYIAKGAIVASTMKSYPEAKKSLVEQGRSLAEVEAMPPLQVVLIYKHQRYRKVRDNQFKWVNLPYWQAKDGFKESERELSEYYSSNQLDVIAQAFMFTMPAIDRVCFLKARFERDFAILRCVEAIRMYAGENGGQLPKSLDDITKVPVPIDPMYGRAFDYKVTDSGAVLESPVPPGGNAKDGMRYEITLRKTTR